jgi:hypothetical protein
MDYSQYDASQSWSNVRSNALIGIKKGLEAIGRTGQFGPYPSLFDFQKVLWEKTKDAVFTTGEKVDNLLHTDQVNSGEYYTISINNFTNEANIEQVIEEMTLHHAEIFPSKIQRVMLAMMGDDSIQIFKAFSELSAVEQDTMKTVVEEVSLSNGMGINKIKTSLRKFYYEYLKKRAEYGFIIPRFPQIQLLASERVNYNLSYQDVVSSYAGLINEHTSRGGNYDINLRLRLFTANMKRGIRKIGLDRQTEIVPGPVGSLVAPRALKGCGMMIDTIMGANLDGLMAVKYDELTKELCNQSMYILDSPELDLSRVVDAQTRDQGTFKEGVDFLRGRYRNDRVTSSMAAEEQLNKRGLSVGHFIYTNYAERVIKSSVNDNPAFKAVNDTFKTSKANLVASRNAELDDRAQYIRTIVSRPIVVYCSEDTVKRDVINHNRNPSLFYVNWEKLVDSVSIVFNDLEFLINKIFTVSCRSGKIPIIVTSDSTMPHDVNVSKYYDRYVASDGDRQVMNDTANVVSSLLPNGHKDPVKDYFRKEFQWLEGVEFDVTDERLPILDYMQEFVPIAGVDERVADIMRRVGVSSSGDVSSLATIRILSELAKDKYFPSDLRPETIVKFLSQPAIIANSTNVVLVLIAMGAAPDIAQSAASKIVQSLENSIFLDQVKTYSTNDQIIGFLNLDINFYSKIARVDCPVEGLGLARAFRGIAGLYSLTLPAEQTCRVVRIRIDGEALPRIERSLKGEMFRDVASYSDYLGVGLFR